MMHVLGHGGILRSAQSFSEISVVWFFEVLAVPAVNCFALISGYVGYRGERFSPRLKNIISLLFTVLFYSIIITLIFKLLNPSAVGLKQILKACMPTITGQYWFFTAYFGVFLFSPLLNAAVYAANKRHLLLFVAVFAFLGAASSINDAFSFMYGYSLIWLACLYILGASIKKYDLINACSRKVWVFIMISVFLLMWMTKIASNLMNVSLLHQFCSFLVSYTSPTVILMAVGWVCLFSKINFKNVPVSCINFFASSAFSVYLIHDNVLIRNDLISKVFKITSDYGAALLPLIIVACVAAIFLLCTLIDKIRWLLFRILRIDGLSALAESMVKRAFAVLCNKINI